jgi:hypothetical protein
MMFRFILVPHNNALGHIFNIYPSPTIMPLTSHQTIEIAWSIRSTMMKDTNLTILLDLFYMNDSSSSTVWSLHILVTKPNRFIDQLFYIILPFLIIFISIQMGILLDTKILIEIIQRPTPIFIGFIAQYGVMPFLAMAIAKIFRYSPLDSLALFVIGCCPGNEQ